jgi:hypothetical protein|tara:strand:+ start:390 stop:521 length:132 start_codon:yes stop_codon:yes gene_type:complete
LRVPDLDQLTQIGVDFRRFLPVVLRLGDQAVGRVRETVLMMAG